MAEASRHDAWQAGDRYEAYMGRWSRLVAPRFLDWLGAPGDMDWIDVGCGTGALSAAILARCSPRSLLAIDPSEGFAATARATLADPRAEARVGDAQALPLGNACKDVVVAGLVLNFVPDMHKALTEMRRVARPGGRVAFYVWDYPGGGLAFVHAFWLAAASLDAAAADLSEDRRFASCTPDNLVALARGAGLGWVECTAIDVPTVFRDFEDYWHPFTLGAGPAPGYCTSLAPEERERLRKRLRSNLPSTEDGAIRLDARAWAIRSIVT
jgi:SAM-dependent methyltransferase